ncbi:MAG: hypothetical protein QOJ89_2733 [bacterium]|jgi:hypothetical protein
MSRRRTVAGLVAAAVAAAPISACGSASDTKSGSGRSADAALHWRIHHGVAHVDGSFVPIFHRRDPFRAGDSYIKWDRLDRGRGGILVQYCVISPTPTTDTHLCTETVVTPRGQLVAVDAHDDLQRVTKTTAAVVGGTGAYEGARGILTGDQGRSGGFVTIRLK